MASKKYRFAGRLTTALLLLALLTGCSIQTGSVPRPAPIVTLTMIDGTMTTLEQLQGKTVVLVFWATYCPYSPAALQRMNELAAGQNGNRKVVFIAVSIDAASDYPKVLERIDSLKLNALKQAFSGGDMYDEAKLAFGVERLPYVYVIDPSGTIVDEGTSTSVARWVVRK